MASTYPGTGTRQVAPDLQATTVPTDRAAPSSLRTDVAILPHSRTPWGAIWGGALAAVSLFVLMEMLTIWLGWVTIQSGAGGIAGTGREWITWIVAVIALCAGGAIAGLTSPARSNAGGALSGFLVWALTTAVIVAASLAGAGLFFGAVGGSVARILLLNPGHTVAGTNLGAFATQAQTAGFWAFITLLTTAAAAIIGGWLGRCADPMGYERDYRTDAR